MYNKWNEQDNFSFLELAPASPHIAPKAYPLDCFKNLPQPIKFDQEPKTLI